MEGPPLVIGPPRRHRAAEDVRKRPKLVSLPQAVLAWSFDNECCPSDRRKSIVAVGVLRAVEQSGTPECAHQDFIVSTVVANSFRFVRVVYGAMLSQE